MGKKRIQSNYRRRTLRLPDLDHSKLAVLNSLGSPGSRRVYEFALVQFIAWYSGDYGLFVNSFSWRRLPRTSSDWSASSAKGKNQRWRRLRNLDHENSHYRSALASKEPLLNATFSTPTPVFVK